MSGELDRALWAQIGRAALVLLEMDQRIALFGLPDSEVETAQQANDLEAAVTRSDELADLLSQAGVQSGQDRVLRLGDGRLLGVTYTVMRDEGGHADEAEAHVWEIDGDVIDLQAAAQADAVRP